MTRIKIFGSLSLQSRLVGLGLSVLLIAFLFPSFSRAMEVTPFTLDDVVTITIHDENPRLDAVDAGFYVYTITLKNNEVRVARVSNGPILHNMFVDYFREIGYVGDVDALAAKAAPVNKPTTQTSFTLDDVVSITKYSESTSDSGYTVYTITLTRGEQHVVRVSNGPITHDMFVDYFRKIGYMGDVDALVAKVKLIPVSRDLVPTDAESHIKMLMELLNKLIALYQQILADSGKTDTPTFPLEPVRPSPVEPLPTEPRRQYPVDPATDPGDPKEEVEVPGVNALSCNRTVESKLSEDKLACYGIWDFGGAFGNDENMCPTNNGYGTPKLGCVVKTDVCKSGEAIATRVVDTRALGYSGGAETASESDIAEISQNLDASEAAVKQELIRVWEYRCRISENEN